MSSCVLLELTTILPLSDGACCRSGRASNNSTGQKLESKPNQGTDNTRHYKSAKILLVVGITSHAFQKVI